MRPITFLRKVSCIGAPQTTGEVRRKCHASAIVEEPDKIGMHGRNIRTEMLETLQPLGWRNLRAQSSGRDWYCKSCANFILKKRKEAKDRWG